MFRKILIWIAVIAVTGTVLFFLLSSYTYSEGSRTGYLVKFSKRGYIFKTYEGELNLGGMNAANNSVVNNIWDFSVPTNETATIDSLRKYEGHVVKAYYKQPLKKFFWQGDTEYFVEKVELVK